MTAAELSEQIAIELDALSIVVDELESLLQDTAGRAPTLREQTAAGAFLAQFYSGIENILKRVCMYNGVALPTGEMWHVELFQRFCLPAHVGLPVLLDDDLATTLAPYRRFRHVAIHSYGYQPDWDRMVEGI